MRKKKRKYTRHPVTPKRVLMMVSRIRGRNNRVWMAILNLAVATKPRKAKALLRQVVENDREVTKWLSKL